MGLTLITPPTVEPVSLEEAKAQVRVTSSAQDAYIATLISGASRFIERYVGRSLTTRQWRLTLDAFADNIELPMGPVTEINAVQYIDENGDTQTLGAGNYTLDLASEPQWLVRNADFDWPSLQSAVNAVWVNYTAGFATLPPEYGDLKVAILLLIGEWFDGRSVSDTSPAMSPPVASLCRPFRPPTLR